MPTLVPVVINAATTAEAFFERFGTEVAWLSDRDGRRVERLAMRELYRRWWTPLDSKEWTEQTDKVVHWPLETAKSDILVEASLKGVSAALTALGNDNGCVLDAFRRQNTPTYLWAIAGAGGTRVRAHQDMFGTASWNLLLSGRKQWRFWHPQSIPSERPPDFSINQQLRELVWIPEEWWHEVDYLSSSLCMSQNLIPLRSVRAVRAKVGEHQPALARHLDALIKLFDCASR